MRNVPRSNKNSRILPCFAVLTAFALFLDKLPATDFLLFKTQNSRPSTFDFCCLGALYRLRFRFWIIYSGKIV